MGFGWRLAIRCILGAMLGATCTTVFVLTCIGRVYRSEASLLFPLPANSLGGGAGMFSLLSNAGAEVPSNSAFPLNTYRTLLLSQPVLSAVAERAHLREQLGIGPAADVLAIVRRMVQAQIDVDRTVSVSATVTGTPQVLSLGELIHRDKAKLRDAKYRRLAQQLVELTIDEMRRLADRLEVDSDKASYDSANKALAEAKQAFDRLTARQQDLQQRSGVLDVEGYAAGLTKALLDSQQQLEELDAQVRGTQSELSQVQSFLKKASGQVEQLPGDLPFLTQLREEYRKAEADLARAERSYGPENAVVLSAKAEANRLRRQLDQAVSMTQRGYYPLTVELNNQLAGLQARRAQAARLARELDQRLHQLPPVLQELVEVKRTLEAQGELLVGLKQKAMAARARYETSGLRWSVLDPPMEPRRKSAPSTMVALVVGTIIGLCVALATFSRQLYMMLLKIGQVSDDAAAA